MMGRWLALLSTAALIIAAAAIDPCKRQPFRGRCPSVGNQPPRRSQFVLRYYARNGECVSYPYGHCASDESEPQLYRYKEECEDSCINNIPQNLGLPKTPEENQTYGTVTPLKESPTVSLQKTSPPEEPTTKSTTVTSPPTTESTTTETVTTTEKTTTEEPTTEAPTTEAAETTTTEATTAAPTTSSTTHATTQSVVETTEEEIEEEEEEEEEANSVNNEEKVQETSTTQTTTKGPTTSAARTECERRREASSSSKIRGGFVPACDSNGNFQKVQCEPDGRQCFCVNSNGIEITNSRTRNGVHPDCARIETAVSPRSQSCIGQFERGPCSSSYTRFYYDEATSKCSTFSYSGCGGNGNNYETESECTRRCVPNKPTVAQSQSAAAPAKSSNDVCSLPKERGPCDKYELRFYYNADTKECKYFFWGGCEGNGNNFETAEACQSSCGVGKANQHNLPRTFAHSSGPIKTIPGVRIGNGSVSSVTGEEIVEVATPPTTVQPVPTQQSTTRFVPQTTRGVPTTQQTTQRTHAPGTTGTPLPPPSSTAAPVPPARSPAPVVVLPGDIEDANRCAHPLDSGSCRGQFVRWFWDSKRNACDVFTYSGCEGNGNNFASREECLAICHKRAEPAPVPSQPDFSNVCKHDIDSGECTGVFQRFAFDNEKEECRPFTYGGCGGNGNNFATMPECQAKCERTDNSPVNVCEFEIEAGECTGVFARFAYDHESNDCRSFTYGGCGGNGNNFASINECRNVCVKKSCLPVSQCDLSHCQIVNDNRGCPFCSCAPPKLPIPNPQCPPLDMSRCLEPCLVINNRRGCQECVCPHLQSTVVPPVELLEPRPPGTNKQTARPPATPERVAPPAGPPQPPRHIATIPGIQEVPKSPLPPGVIDDIQEKCLQPMETGPCKQFVDRWFFNKEDGTCHPFKYGGCAGNRNHFFTQRECEIHCARFLREASEENSGERDEFETFPPARAAGVSSVHVLEPLPVENYKSPEPPLRGAYGKKNYLEPATTQGVKITTSTARPSTTTTTPTTTRTTTTASTTVKIEENVDAENEEEVEEEPEEITTTTKAPTTTTEKIIKVVPELPKETVKEEIERITSEVGKDVREEQEEEEEELEEEAIATTTIAPASPSRASRLLETATEAVEEEKEEEVEEEKEEASGSVEATLTAQTIAAKVPEITVPAEEITVKVVEPTEGVTTKPELETTLINEINSMEREEGVEENEITPSSMMSSSKFAVHRETVEARHFEEVNPDLKQVSVENKEELHGTLLKKVEITRPPATITAPPTTEAPSTEAATRAESTPSTTKVAESTTSAATIQTSAKNLEITESTTPRPASTVAPTTPSTTQSRSTTTSDKSEEPNFDPNAVKKIIEEPNRAAGVAQVTVEPSNGIGRQPVPIANLPDMDPETFSSLDLEVPTTIFPTTKSASVRPTPSPQNAPRNPTLPTAQTTRAFDSHDPRIICAMPADAGYCDKYEARWFFNSQTGQCEQFSYGGCAGNMNNFVNRTLCELSCMASHPGLASQVPERCSYDKDAGFGKGYNVKWYFNMRNLRCEQFVYEGKGGNTNQFETLSDCERFCSPQPTRPTQAPRQTLPTLPTATATQPVTTRVAPTQSITTRAPTAATQSTAAPTAAVSIPLVPLPTAPRQTITDEEDAEEYPDEEENTLAPSLATRGPIPPIAPSNILPTAPINPPGTEPKPPAFASKINNISAINAENVNQATHTSSAPKAAAPVASTLAPEVSTYKAEAIKPANLGIDPSNLKPIERIVAPSPKEDVNYQSGARQQGLPSFSDGRLPPPDSEDIKNEDEKTIRPSCPNGNKELRYTDGRPVMCLPGHKQCPDKSVCYFNGMDYFCCPNEDDPYDRHVFGGYGGDEVRNGYKVFGPLRIRRLMDEVPLRAKRQTSMDKAFNTNPVSFNLDSVVAPLRFDSEKPRHVSRALMMRKPNPPKHGNPMCILPVIEGNCNAAHLRYYYDRNSDSCRLFYYTGCQGNANNFGSLEDCQRLCVLGGQVAPAVQADAVTPATVVTPGQCPTGSPLGGNLPVLCGNSTESIGCPTGYYCRGGPPDICCPGVDPNLKSASVQHGVKNLPETTPVPGVPRNYYKEQLISTPLYMCPDASDPLMGENGVPAVCGAGFDGVKMCPKGYYCAIDGAKGSRLCCPLFGSSASKIPTESIYAPTLSRRNPNPGEVIDRGSLPFDQVKYDRDQKVELPSPTAAPTTTEAPEEEEYEDDEDPQKLRIKAEDHSQNTQENVATNSSDISQEPLNIDVPKEEPTEEPTTTEAPVKLDKSICQLKPTEGRACREDEKAPRTNLHYFYSAKDRRCKLYFYRGCGGSFNRFEKKADCEALCLNA